MNCETCKTTLARLASGELDEMTADEARAHLQACASCRLAFEQLGVPLSGVAENGSKSAKPAEPELIEAKEAALPAALQKERESRPRRGVTASGEWRLRVGRTGRLLMGQQFAVAVAMLLVAAVGLWYVPRFRENSESAGTVVDGPDMTDGKPGKGALEPAEPLDLTMDQNRRRIRSKQEVAAAARRRAAVLEQATAEPPQKALAEIADPGSEFEMAAAYHGQTAEQGESETDEAAETRADGPAAEPTDSLFERAMARYRAGEHEAARADLVRVAGRADAGEMAPEALLHLGRSYRAEGKWATALRYYEALLQRFPRYAGRAEALAEAGECRQKVDGPKQAGTRSGNSREPTGTEPETPEPGSRAER
jgi:TolA-binding protein